MLYLNVYLILLMRVLKLHIMILCKNVPIENSYGLNALIICLHVWIRAGTISPNDGGLDLYKAKSIFL